MELLKNCIPASFRKHLKKKGEEATSISDVKKSLFQSDKQNRLIVDINILRQQLDKERDDEAIQKHKNDPNIRLDMDGFPRDRIDRKFLLNHNFGSSLSKIMKYLTEDRWIYLHGPTGRGKTALATRAIWEYIKLRPCMRSTFISVYRWVGSHMPNSPVPPLSINTDKLILIDDFDKFDLSKSFQIRMVLNLIETVKHQNGLALITAQYSIKDLLKISKQRQPNNPESYEVRLILDRIRGKAKSFTFQGKSKR